MVYGKRFNMIKTIKVFFEQDEVIWVYLFISSGNQVVKIDLSPVFPPFNDILNFLENILNKKETKIEIDEEGIITELHATHFKKGNFYFVLIKNALRKNPYTLEGEYEINNFVFEFANKFSRFIKRDFDINSWKKYKVQIDKVKLNNIYVRAKKIQKVKKNGRK